MTLALPERFVLFDTEYTAWEGSMERGWSRKGEHKEVIQIGAVKTSLATLAEESVFSILVRPVKNPELSPYIIALTGITQERVNAEGVTLGEALSDFADFIGDLPAFSYGDDGAVIEGNCALTGTPYPFAQGRFQDIRPVITPLLVGLGIDTERYSSGTLIQAFGKAPTLRAHDAVNDMRNLLAVLRELQDRI